MGRSRWGLGAPVKSASSGYRISMLFVSHVERFESRIANVSFVFLYLEGWC